jgi:hypothetical protein
MTMKVPVPSDYVFSARCAVSRGGVKDFDAKGSDDQARDKETNKRLWQVRVLDLDPEAGRFGASKEVKVKIAADQARRARACRTRVPARRGVHRHHGDPVCQLAASLYRQVPGTAGLVGAG